MVTVDAGLSHFYLAYGIIGMIAGLAVVVMFLVRDDAHLELDLGGYEPHPFLVMIVAFSITFYLWPVALAMILWAMNDDDGPWKG